MNFRPLAKIRSSRLQEFAAYLEGKRAGGKAIDRTSIDPIVEIPRLANALLLIERIRLGQPDESRFRIRLVGTGLAAVAGVDFTGRWLDEIGISPEFAEVFDHLREIFAATDLLCGSRVLPWEDRAHVVVEWVAATLASAPGVNDLVIFAFDRQPGSD